MKKKKIIMSALTGIFCLTSLSTIVSCDSSEQITPNDNPPVADVISYTVTFKDYDGNVIKTSVFNENTTISYSGTAPIRSGYTFKGWDKTNDGVVDSLGTATSNVTFVAVYEANAVVTASHTVTFTVDGTTVFNKTVKEGETIDWSGLTDPTKTGYTFSGWDFGDGNPTKTLPTTMSTSDISATAIFTQEQGVEYLPVTFYDYDGQTVLLATQVEKKSNVYTNILALYTSATPSRPSDSNYDYTFLGWNENRTASTADNSFSAITSTFTEIKLYAIYQATPVVNDNDQTDETRQMIENSYFDTTQSWSRQSYVCHTDPDTSELTIAVTEEKYNATLGSYYRKVTELEQNSHNKENGWYDSDSKTFTGGTVVQEFVLDKNVGWYDITLDSFMDWETCSTDWGLTYDELIKLYITHTSTLTMGIVGGIEYLVEEMKVFADLDKEGHTVREGEISEDLFVAIQQNYDLDGYTYDGYFAKSEDFHDLDTYEVTRSYDVWFSMDVIRGARGGGKYEFGLNYEDVGDLMTTYRK